MAKRHAELFEIRVGQFRQNFRVDFALAKDRLILAKAEATEPISHVHGCNPERKGTIAQPTQPVEGA